MVGNDTVARPGGDAAVVRVHGTNKALAITTDCTPRYCFADPIEGGKQAVAETWRNLTAVGATPLAITNCLNFGNPQKPEIMGQIVGCLDGMAQACRVLDYPIISGNASLYNETNGQGIQPTPAIGGVGILKDVSKAIGNSFTAPGLDIFVVGDTKGHLGSSLYLREILGREEGAPPPVDLALERKHGDFVRGLIQEGLVAACHDISDGGLLVAIAEMSYKHGIGANLTASGDAAFWFGEDQARYLIAVDNAAATRIQSLAESQKISLHHIGTTHSDTLQLDGETIALTQLTQAHEAWLPSYMA
jgi:phosphoribosylformylglycinamidine (FGAM) synthase-like enzyme